MRVRGFLVGEKFGENIIEEVFIKNVLGNRGDQFLQEEKEASRHGAPRYKRGNEKNIVVHCPC